MRARYRRVWTALVCVLGGLGGLVALLSTEGGVLFSVAALSGVVVAVTHHCVSQGVPARARQEDLVDFIAVGSAAGLALTGYIELLGPHWIPGALVLVVLSPAVGSLLTPVFDRMPAVASYLAADPVPVGSIAVHAAAESEGVLPHPGPVTGQPATMTVTELCLAWRTSFLALDRLGDGAQRDQVVASRQQYLDELERRDPLGFSRWLADGASPGSNPRKYLRAVRGPQPRS